MISPSTKRRLVIEYKTSRAILPAESLFVKNRFRALDIISGRQATYKAWFKGELIFHDKSND